ncbi:hypothetical protein JG688_00018503 [Phytophthora aleatoria]|uniref:Uncharacterized protein n=1 Tax=Phytophthora aleatoria TaxID=2496075 RepID=A0A8J5IBW1_9STRA|nr:hypothetical protein JG688_00018503 [Phytophthora aleatoria]
MTAGELNPADLELNQETFVALQRIQAEAAGTSDPHAVLAALAKAAYHVAHGKLHKRIRPGGEDSDNDLGVDPDSSSEDKPLIPTDQASSAMSATGLGDDATAEPSSPKSGRRVICSFSIKSKFASHKSSLTVAFPISVSHEVVDRSSEVSVAVLKDDRPPELIDLTFDVEMSSSPEDSPPATPSAEKGSRDPVPPPTGGNTVPEAPAPLAEASSVTKEIPDSGPPSPPPPKATPSAVPGDEDEGITFHDLVALFGSDDDDGD